MDCLQVRLPHRCCGIHADSRSRRFHCVTDRACHVWPSSPQHRRRPKHCVCAGSGAMTGCEERFLTKSSCGDAGQGWREEAAAVIQDIRDCVNDVTVSQHLPCNESGAYLNMETKECNKVTVEMSTAGFRICGRSYDSLSCRDGKNYETIYALLDDTSPGYRSSFASALAQKLSHLSQDKS